MDNIPHLLIVNLVVYWY